MTAPRSITVFDIIGPVMVGPSSSHTAGAVRLGQIARAIFGSQPEQALIQLHGSFAETGRGHGTDKALIAGLLGLDTSDDQISHSFELAQKSGLNFSFENIDLGELAHPNTVRFYLSSQSQQIQITGASTGGGLIEITNIQGYPVNFDAQFETLIIVADDKPGTINSITGWLLNQNINVAFFKVGREKRGGQAIMVIETDETIPDTLVRAIEGFSWVIWARKISRLKE